MFRIIDYVLFAFERLWQHRVLVFWAILGLAAATTLALSLLLYVDAVNTDLLTSRLPDPPYAFRYRYVGSWKGNVTPADVTAAKAAVMDGFTNTIGLPAALKVDYTASDPWSVRRDKTNLGALSLGTLNGAESQMLITAGEWPPQSVKTGDPLPVLISEQMLYKMGVQVGDTLTVTPTGGKAVTLKVSALWKPIDAKDPAWIFTPKFFDEIILLTSDDFGQIVKNLSKPIAEADWYVSFNGSTVKTADVGGLLERITDGQRDVASTLPGVRLDVSPVEQLTKFSNEVQVLTQQLVIIVMPVAGLVLYFVSLVAGLLVTRQQAEDVTLRSRGMSRISILMVHVMMWLILAGIALGVGLVASGPLVQLVGRTTSFLRFNGTNAPLTIIYTPTAIAAGVITGLIAASSGLLLAWRTTRQTITSFKQQTARATKAWWQRAYLDLMLLVPAYYVLFTLNQKGGLVTTASDPFSDPIVFIGPTLFALGNTLLFLRLWPFIIRIGERLMTLGSGVSIMMALRELTRSIGRYRGALLMMCFTLSLIGFTASMASTLDRSLEDTIGYTIGADAVLVTASDAQTTDSSDSSSSATTTVTGFNTLPVADLLTVDGVDQAARVGRYPAQIKLSTQYASGTVLAVDRAAMAAVTKFRADYATLPVADLFNLLATNRAGILINSQAAAQYKLKVGQTIDYQVQALNQWYPLKAPILGLVDYFPTLDPRTNFFIIANIDPVFEAIGTELPSDYWMSLKPGADQAKVEAAVAEKGYPVIQWLNPQDALQEALSGAARRGVLGFLSVGFIASIVLTLVSSIIQNAASFKAQAVHLGSLQAMGLSSFAVSLYLFVSQGLAVSSGILGGTVIGAATTLLFLPLLDFSGGLPPYLVRVAWSDIITVYALFAGVLFAVTLFTTFLLGRQHLFTVVKLGDSA